MDSNVNVATMSTFGAQGSSAIDRSLGVSTHGIESSPTPSNRAPTVESISPAMSNLTPTAESVDDLPSLSEALNSNDPNRAPTSQRRSGDHQTQANLDTTNAKAVRVTETSSIQQIPKSWDEKSAREQIDEIRRGGDRHTQPARPPRVRP